MIKIKENGGEAMDPKSAGACNHAANSLWSLETLGKVTDGVAHDFNNILATISGFAELILSTDERQAGQSKEVNAFARHILQAALTGQSTVRQLRGFTRQRADEKEILDLHEVLLQSLAMARGALGGRITLSSDFMSGSPLLMGCSGMLHNVFLNLFFNARDAMPGGGDISVRTFMLRTGVPTVAGIPKIAVISVRDTGTGMTEEVLDRVFEPFFSTKGAQGSGMGLANVDDTIKAHGGWITVDSAPGRGSEFRIHLPLVSPDAEGRE